MADVDRKLELVPRPSHVRITGRPCVVCKRDVQRSLVIRFVKPVQFDLNFCDRCLLDACATIRMGSDHLCTVAVESTG